MAGEKTVVIVESPTKAKTIAPFLPEGWTVLASVGHVRDLPKSTGDIPKRYQGKPWTKFGVDLENDFSPIYVTIKGKNKIIQNMRKATASADVVVLATDEDREGESISWHLCEVLKTKAKIVRMVFHEITKSAIVEAMNNFRSINMDMVTAQETRRILDRLYGYTLSELIWKKIAFGLSAGRVQSPCLRLIVEREKERIVFARHNYWGITALVNSFEVRLHTIGGKRIVDGSDFDSITGKFLAKKNRILLNKEKADELVEVLPKREWRVSDVKKRKSSQHPPIPFITSTLEQQGVNALKISAKEVMRSAQRLYEGGYITYMRTDSPHLSSQAIRAARSAVKECFGDDYLSEKPRQYTAKSKQAQEAHEAIRPSGEVFRHPDTLSLGAIDAKLYRLIWKRTLGTQMKSAQRETVTIDVAVEDCLFRAGGSRIVFPGFLALYQDASRERSIPNVDIGTILQLGSIEPEEHFTQPPPRYTESTIVQQLEKLGIGRPSTYATTISTLFDRKYASNNKGSIAPTFTGIAVAQLLEKHFPNLVDYTFTSEMEDALDKIAYGELNSLDYLRKFWQGPEGLEQQVNERYGTIAIEHSRSISMPYTEITPDIRIGRYGPYLVWKDENGESSHASIPETKPPADITVADFEEITKQQIKSNESLGIDPATGSNIYCLIGRYGPYVQLGEKSQENKPRRAAIPTGVQIRDVTIDLALKWLSLPRELGKDPSNGEMIIANIGRFGPYVGYAGSYRSVPKDEDVYTIGLERALQLLAIPRSSSSREIRDLGFDKENKISIKIVRGRYGPHIKYGTRNIGLPKDMKSDESIQSMTTEQALAIIADTKKAGTVSKRKSSRKASKK